MTIHFNRLPFASVRAWLRLAVASLALVCTAGLAQPVAVGDIVTATSVGGIANVLSNDTFNGAAATSANSTPGLVSNGGLTGLAFNASAQLVVPTVAAGSYIASYQLCDALRPTTCSPTVNITINVTAVAVARGGAIQVPPTGGPVAVNVLTNDTFNGAPATSANVTASLLSSGGLAGLLLSSAGVLQIPVAAAGSYAPTYMICDITAPANCSAAATINITMLAGPVAAADSASLTVVGGVVSVLGNDSFNGGAATTSNVVPAVVNNGGIAGLSFNAAGQLVVPAVAFGSYAPAYRICDAALAVSCSAAVAINLTVSPVPPQGVPDSALITPAGGVVSVLANDTLNGGAATAANVTVGIVSNGGIAALSVNASGQLVVPAGVPAGTYAPTYSLCVVGSPSTCSAAVAVSLTVSAGPVASADAAVLLPSGGLVTVLGNDSFNGAAATTGNVVVSLVANGGIAGLSFNGAGQLVVPAVAAGTYAPTYRICDIAAPANCSAATTVNITVASGPVALADTVSVPRAGGVVSVLANDTLSGAAATLANVTPAIVSSGGLAGLSLNAAGQLVIGAQAAGSYAPTYRICEVANPASCSPAATVNVTVLAGPVATADTAVVVPTGGTVDVLANDTFNGAPATGSNVSASVVSNGGIAGLAFNAAGQLQVPALAAGSYSASYRICDLTSPTSCAGTTTVSITVGAVVVAAADSAGLTTSGGVVNVLANDSFNGAAAVVTTVAPTLVSNGGIAGLAFNAAGQLVVPAVAAGTYAPTYRICWVSGPTNCSAVTTASIVVAAAPAPVPTPVPIRGGTTAAVLLAKDDGITMPLRGGTLNVLANDLYNGAAVGSGSVTLTLTADGGMPNVALAASGNLEVPPNTLARSYLLEYRMCATAEPANCSTAKVNILVSASVSSPVRRAPSAPGALSAVTTILTTGQSPLSFGTGGPVPAGSASDPLVFSGVRIGFGDSVGGSNFQSVRESEAIPGFGAQLLYGGAGQLRARWEVIQPGDPNPNEFDLVPEDGLTVQQLAQRHVYLLVDRSTAYLSPTGSYYLKGPDVARLPRLQLGSYRVLLRLESTGAGRSGNFYIPMLTYRIESDPPPPPVPESSAESGAGATESGEPKAPRKRFTADINVADFSQLGELDRGAMLNEAGSLKVAPYEKKPVQVGFESIAVKLPTAGQQFGATEPVKLEWEAAKQASVEFWHVEVRTDGGQLLAVARVARRTDYQLPRPLVASMPRNSPLRWRVRGLDKDGHVTATSAWLYFSLGN